MPTVAPCVISPICTATLAWTCKRCLTLFSLYLQCPRLSPLVNSRRRAVTLSLPPARLLQFYLKSIFVGCPSAFSANQLRESVLQLVNSLTTGFIWHRDPFGLSVAVPSEEGVEPHLHGEQLFGGNVSDEWFVCYLLSAITSSFSR